MDLGRITILGTNVMGWLGRVSSLTFKMQPNRCFWSVSRLTVNYCDEMIKASTFPRHWNKVPAMSREYIYTHAGK